MNCEYLSGNGFKLTDANDSDVFMDSVNRQIAMKMLVSAADTW